MNVALVSRLRPRTAGQQVAPQADLVTCSLCLRVLRGSAWVEAEDVIRETRSYELVAPPQLEPAVCELCADSIFSRRALAGDAVAA